MAGIQSTSLGQADAQERDLGRLNRVSVPSALFSSWRPLARTVARNTRVREIDTAVREIATTPDR